MIGDSISVVGVGAGGGGAPPQASIPVGGYSVTDGTAGTAVVGGSPVSLDDGDYERTGLTAAWALVVCASVTSGDTGTVTLWDVDAGSAAAEITVTATDPATEHVDTITPPTSSTTYELRASCTGGTAADYLVINSAAIRVTWS